MNEEERRACRHLRWLGVMGLLLWIGWLPVGLTLIIILNEASTSLIRTAAHVGLGLYMGAFLLIGVMTLLWKCPRCGKTFHSPAIWLNVFWWKTWRSCWSCGVSMSEVCNGRTRWEVRPGRQGETAQPDSANGNG